MSFFSDAQESPALIFPELHVEMLALYLQFSRLDDVIHFPLKAPTLPHSFWGMEEKSAVFFTIFGNGMDRVLSGSLPSLGDSAGCSLRCDIKGPSQNDCDWKTDDDQNND